MPSYYERETATSPYNYTQLALRLVRVPLRCGSELHPPFSQFPPKAARPDHSIDPLDVGRVSEGNVEESRQGEVDTFDGLFHFPERPKLL